MAIIYSYELMPDPEQETQFRTAVAVLQASLTALEGFEGACLVRDMNRDGTFRLDERWTSIADHDGQSAKLDRGIMTRLMETLREEPVRRLFETE